MPLAQLISATHLQQRLGQDNLVALDCRFALEDPAYGRRSYLDGHIPGAHFLDLEQDLSAPVVKGVTGRHPLPDPSALVERLRSCGLRADSQVAAALAGQARWSVSARRRPESLARGRPGTDPGPTGKCFRRLLGAT
jgi:thiosulfate/3-mercaptopyruvate sulfurtransferase